MLNTMVASSGCAALFQRQRNRQLLCALRFQQCLAVCSLVCENGQLSVQAGIVRLPVKQATHKQGH